MDEISQCDYKTDEFPLIVLETECLSMEIKVESMDYEVDSAQPSHEAVNYSPNVSLPRLTDLEILILQEEIKRSQEIKEEPIDQEQEEPHEIKDEPIDQEQEEPLEIEEELIDPGVINHTHEIKEEQIDEKELLDPGENPDPEKNSIDDDYCPSSSSSSSEEEDHEDETGDSDPDQPKPHRRKKQIICSVCDKKCDNRESLNAHRATHVSIKLKSGWITSKAVFECPLCPVSESLPTFEEFKSHLFETHVPALKIKQKSNRVKCPKCDDLSLADGKALMEHLFKSHMTGSNGPPLLLCCEGDFEDPLLSKVENHLHKVHHIHKCICLLCGLWVADMKNHMLMHSGKRPVSCPDCGQTFRNNKRMGKHRSVHSKFVSNSTFIKVDQSLTCRICSSSSTETDFDGFKEFTEHVFQTHVPSEMDGGVVECKVCEDKLENGVLFLDHIFEKHRPSESPLKCPKCSFAGSTPSVVFRHLNSKHYLGRRLCPICGRAVRDVNTHKKIMHGVKGFECQQCKSKHSSEVNLKRHMKIHSGERPFICDYCSYACARADNFREHKRQAHGIFTYNCAACGKGFARKKEMVNHALQHEE